MSGLLVLKIGGSVLTDKAKIETARLEEIRRIAAEVREGLSGALVLIHGAGSFGHHQAKEYGLKAGLNPRSIKGILPTHKAVRTLNMMIVDALNDAGVNALPVHPLSACQLNDGRIQSMQLYAVRTMLANGIVPVLHGDVAMDASKGIDVLSGDQLIEYMAKALGARKAGIGTNVDGVYAKDFKYIREITPATVSDFRDALAGSGGVDVTGGMYGKVMELLALANNGVPSLVFNAGTPGNVTKFLKGEEITGTMIHGD